MNKTGPKYDGDRPMDAPEPPAIPATDSVPLPRIALISLLACLLFLSGMVTMYLFMSFQGFAPVRDPYGHTVSLGSLFSLYGERLWDGLIWPVFAAAKSIFIDHAFYIVALFVLAGDRIMDACIAIVEMAAAWRAQVLMFLCGAGFIVIVLTLYAGTGTPAPGVGCLPGQMLTAGGDCLWINRY